MEDARIRALEAVLAANPGRLEEVGPATARASVAVIVRPAPDGLELLLIRRADRESDPWSGHMALPGGRAAPTDADAAATAVRETREEVDIDLDAVGRPLGSLDELAPRTGAPHIAVRPFVFAVPAGTEAVGNHEVAAALWVGVAELADPAAAAEHRLDLPGGAMRFPAFGTRGYVIWGLTHRILSRFLELHALSESV